MSPAPWSFTNLQALAESHGGGCLTALISSESQPVRMECALRHTFSVTARALLDGAWCPHCAAGEGPPEPPPARVVRDPLLVDPEIAGAVSGGYHAFDEDLGIESEPEPASSDVPVFLPTHPSNLAVLEEMRQLATTRGGECVSPVVVVPDAPLVFRCGQGHFWSARPASIRDGSWCTLCASAAPVEHEELKELARRSQLSIPGPPPVNDARYVHWRCAKGHDFWATVQALRADPTCMLCASDAGLQATGYSPPIPRPPRPPRQPKRRPPTRPLTDYPEVQNCAAGHIWVASEAERVAGKTCPDCAKLEQQRPDASAPRFQARDSAPATERTIGSLQALAKSLGGRCLSVAIYDERTGIQWECAKKHTWYALPKLVDAGEWCPECGKATAHPGRKGR